MKIKSNGVIESIVDATRDLAAVGEDSLDGFSFVPSVFGLTDEELKKDNVEETAKVSLSFLSAGEVKDFFNDISEADGSDYSSFDGEGDVMLIEPELPAVG